MCPIFNDILPLDEVFLDSLIQSNLLLDVGSIVTKSNPYLLNQPDLFFFIDLLLLVLLSLRTLPLIIKSVILMSLIFLMIFSTSVILILFLQTLSSLLIFALLLRLILLIINPQALVL